MDILARDNMLQLSDNWEENPFQLEDSDVIRLNLHYFYNLSTVLQPLKSIETGQKITDLYGELYQAEAAIDALLGDNTLIPVRTCWDTGNALRTAIRRVLNKFEEKEEIPAGQEPQPKVFNYWDQFQITNAVEKFEIVLSAELQILDSYFVTQKGGYSTGHLIARGESLIPDEVRPVIPEQALDDFKQGCRCLAFELSTAVGFHLLRATEAVLRAYYNEMAVKKSAAQINWTMGTYIHNLKGNGGDAKVVAVLEQVTRLHRNPLMHPEDVLTQTEAIVLIGVVTSAICAMGDGIRIKRETTAQLSLVPTPPLAMNAAKT